MYLLGLIVLLFNGVLGFWVVDINKTPGAYNQKWATVMDLETASTSLNGTVQTLCAFSFGYNGSIHFNSDEYGGCYNGTSVALITENSTLLYLQQLHGSKIGCQLSESDDEFDSYLCADKFLVASLTTQTTTIASATQSTTIKPTSTKTTSTTSAKPTTTCTSGFSGKSNGGGPTGACCKTSNDCEDTCTKGVCGVHP
jgi:hypothetical protein